MSRTSKNRTVVRGGGSGAGRTTRPPGAGRPCSRTRTERPMSCCRPRAGRSPAGRRSRARTGHPRARGGSACRPRPWPPARPGGRRAAPRRERAAARGPRRAGLPPPRARAIRSTAAAAAPAKSCPAIARTSCLRQSARAHGVGLRGPAAGAGNSSSSSWSQGSVRSKDESQDPAPIRWTPRRRVTVHSSSSGTAWRSPGTYPAVRGFLRAHRARLHARPGHRNQRAVPRLRNPAAVQSPRRAGRLDGLLLE